MRELQVVGLDVDGTRLICETADSGEKFMLNVAKNGHVNGNFGDQAVEYDVSKRVRDKVAAQLGEGPTVAEATLRK